MKLALQCKKVIYVHFNQSFILLVLNREEGNITPILSLYNILPCSLRRPKPSPSWSFPGLPHEPTCPPTTLSADYLYNFYWAHPLEYCRVYIIANITLRFIQNKIRGIYVHNIAQCSSSGCCVTVYSSRKNGPCSTCQPAR